MKIFISHATEDHHIAEAWKQLLEGLTSNLVEVWYASDLSNHGGIPGGQDWRNSLIHNLTKSAVVIAILTPPNSSRPWILWECGVAMGTNEQILIFPVVYDKKRTECPGPLQQYQVFDGIEESDVKRICQQVLQTNNKRASISKNAFPEFFDAYITKVMEFLSHLSAKGDIALQDVVSHELHQRWVLDADWYGLDKQSVVSISDDATIKKINLTRPGEIKTIVEDNSVKCFAVIPGTSLLVYGIVGGKVKLANMDATEHMTHHLFHHDQVRVIAYNQSKSIIATGGYNEELQVHSIDLNHFTSNLLFQEKQLGPVRAITWSHGESSIAFSNGPVINLQRSDEIDQSKRRKTLLGHTGTVLSLVWTNDNKYVASGDELGNVIVWNAISGRESYRINRFLSLGIIRSIAFKPGTSNVLAVGGQTGKIEIIKLTEDGPEITQKRITAHPTFINRVRWSMPENTVLVTFDASIALLYLDSEEGEHIDDQTIIA